MAIKPFIKWAGGKTQLLSNIMPTVPANTKLYIEPFVGGGAVLISLLDKRPDIESYIVNDLNSNLIDVYNAIKYNYKQLEINLKKIADGFEKSGNKKDFFYQKRNEYNKLVNKSAGNMNNNSDESIKKSALFIFLNKTCFNGLYRVNRKGEFNVPYNNTEKFNPDFANLKELHKKFVEKNITFISGDYYALLYNDAVKSIIASVEPEEVFVYLDPPYKPATSKNGLLQYTSGKFDDNEQFDLKRFCDDLDDRGFKFVQSNSDPNTDDGFFDKLYDNYTIVRVNAARNINADVTGRGKVNEILISN